MSDEARKLLDKAARALLAAETLRSAGNSEFAAGRAYYAMFYTASAVLVAKGLRFRKHAGVHASFGEHFARTGVLDPKFHRWLLDAFDKRLLDDYGIDAVVTAADVDAMLSQARELVAAATAHLAAVT